MYLLTNNTQSKGSSRAPQHWSAAEETQLKELFGEFEDAVGMRNTLILNEL